ncbi:MAG: DUF481 domain-containing protein [Deltaproteobacteria bacterium]|jgi:hypothetical protein|nr:DUF481 domain-containing protein [Deltaproteobacteria bacterium]
MRPHCLAACILGICAPALAHAGPGEQAISLTPGYATFSDGEGDEEIRAHGGALGLDYEYRISQAVSFRGSGSGAYYRAEGETAYSAQGVVGLTYALDIIKYVPYLTGGIGGLYIGGGDNIDGGLNPIVEVGGGLDILHSREWSYGVTVRYETLLQNTDYLFAGIRLTRRWGFF